ncbi:hypothetical protein LPTSP3_g19050 [Leptospira kobayashii]|uniref:HTH lysR-type domain-containing protein n=1 Tax=Leptospira kobayashii TaxID=1917830 RepID=A0ABM7UJQ2_9LEPT|nr:LysR family transcriptional regulator [Leptospira kobayashii]BDA78975.1 hypothetical protein LPTSP3_g19050 [Leptospira kobayashii]
MINLELYRTFFTIYREGTLTRAAQVLLMTQPGVSQQLQSLENYTGKQLFERTSRKMIPTEYGKILYSQIVGPLERLNGIENEFRKTNLKKETTIRLGSPIEFYSEYLLSLFTRPDFDFQVSFGIVTELIDKLKKEEIQLAIVSQKIQDPEIEYETFTEEKFILVGSPKLNRSDFPGKNKSGRDWDLEKEKWLSGQNWYVYSSDLAIVRRFWKENFQKRPSIKPKLVLPNLKLICESLLLGEGVSVLPSYLFRKKKQNYVWFPEFREATNTLYFASLAGSKEKNRDTKSQIIKMVEKEKV